VGVLDRVEEQGGVPLAGTAVFGPRGSRLQGLFARAAVAPFRPTGLSVQRRFLDAILVDRARRAGATVAEGLAVTDLLYDGGNVAGAVARDAGGQVRLFRARLTAGADGLRSTVARRLGVRRHGFPARMAFVAYFDGVADLTDCAEMHVGPQGYVGLNPLGNGLANVALVVPRRLTLAARGDPTGFLLARLGCFPAVYERIAAGRIVRRTMVTGPFAYRASRVTTGGALLLGDAADFFDPFTGEGICSALRGAELAAETAIEALETPGIVDAARLKPYARARRAAFAGKWAVERLIGWGMLAPRLFDRAVRNLESRGWSHTFIGVTGDFVPPGAVLNPRVLTGMLW
jgi:flavin-dependent dehydrogenase